MIHGQSAGPAGRRGEPGAQEPLDCPVDEHNAAGADVDVAGDLQYRNPAGTTVKLNKGELLPEPRC